MNYYIDTEFLEGTQKEKFPISLFRKETPNTIDLISIGIVSEDGREYYAVSKDFNLKEAWNRWQQRTGEGDRNNIEPRLYWIRENVLKPIYRELRLKELNKIYPYVGNVETYHKDRIYFKELKRLINKYGKTNKQIAEEVKRFVYSGENVLYNHPDCKAENAGDVRSKINFYAYYADYDSVVFRWLFGKMVDLPKGFPKYCIDLKQELDNRVTNYNETISYWRDCSRNVMPDYDYIDSFFAMGVEQVTVDLSKYNLDYKLSILKKYHSQYPKQINEHNALSDARWNKKLHKFLNKL